MKKSIKVMFAIVLISILFSFNGNIVEGKSNVKSVSINISKTNKVNKKISGISKAKKVKITSSNKSVVAAKIYKKGSRKLGVTFRGKKVGIATIKVKVYFSKKKCKTYYYKVKVKKTKSVPSNSDADNDKEDSTDSNLFENISKCNLQGSFSNPCVNLTWSKISGAVSYKVYRREAGEDWKVVSSFCTQCQYDDGSIESDKTYIYCIKAKNGKSLSDYSSEISVTTGTVIRNRDELYNRFSATDCNINVQVLNDKNYSLYNKCRIVFCIATDNKNPNSSYSIVAEDENDEVTYISMNDYDDVDYDKLELNGYGTIKNCSCKKTGIHTFKVMEDIYLSGYGDGLDGTYSYDTGYRVTVKLEDYDTLYNNFLETYIKDAKSDVDNGVYTAVTAYPYDVRVLYAINYRIKGEMKYTNYITDGNSSYQSNLLRHNIPFPLNMEGTCYMSSYVMMDFIEKMGYESEFTFAGYLDHHYATAFVDGERYKLDACPDATGSIITKDQITKIDPTIPNEREDVTITKVK